MKIKNEQLAKENEALEKQLKQLKQQGLSKSTWRPALNTHVYLPLLVLSIGSRNDSFSASSSFFHQSSPSGSEISKSLIVPSSKSPKVSKSPPGVRQCTAESLLTDTPNNKCLPNNGLCYMYNAINVYSLPCNCNTPTKLNKRQKHVNQSVCYSETPLCMCFYIYSSVDAKPHTNL